MTNNLIPRDKKGRFIKGHSFRVGIRHTPESIQKMRDSHKGCPVSQEARRKISKKLKGKPSNNPFKKGHKTNIGKHYLNRRPRPQTEETREKIGKAHRGSRNWNWKGGITPKEKLARVKFQQTIQKQVFERDNYTCQVCGQKGGYLQVDHIQSWKEYTELRFNMNNCRTVCMDCHYKITFGKPRSNNVKTWGHNLSYLKGRVLT